MTDIALAELVTEVQSGFASGQRDTEGVIQVRMNNVSTDGALNLENFIRVPATSEVIRKFELKPGDVLFNSTNSPELVGKAALFNGAKEPVVFSNHFLRIRTNPKRLNASFLSRWLNWQWTMRIFEGRCTQWVNQASIRREDLLTIKVPLADQVEEQKRIATILDKADAIRRNRQQAIQLADEFLRSVFLDMFGDPTVNSKGLPEKPIKDLAYVTTGNTPSRDVSIYYGDFIEWIKSDNINTPSHYLTKAAEGLSEEGLRVGRSVPVGSTLITCIAGSPSCIGNAALADRPVSFNQQINALTPKPGIPPEFLYAATLFSKRRIQGASTNSMKGMVSKGALEEVMYIWPSENDRDTFVKTFKRVISFQGKLLGSKRNSDELFSSLTQRAFHEGI